MSAKRNVPLLALFAMASSLIPSLSAQMNYLGQPPQRPMPTIRCESRGNRRNYCSADTRGGISLVRQLGQAQCVQGRTLGI